MYSTSPRGRIIFLSFFCSVTVCVFHVKITLGNPVEQGNSSEERVEFSNSTTNPTTTEEVAISTTAVPSPQPSKEENNSEDGKFLNFTAGTTQDYEFENTTVASTISTIISQEEQVEENLSERIINGEVVQSRANFNYLARVDVTFQGPVLTTIPNPVAYFCAGALISVNFVLTAAQCVVQRKTLSLPSRIQVALGDLDYKKTESGEQFSDADATIHPNFNRDTLANDIAMLKLKTPAILTTNVGVINPETTATTNWVDQTVDISGWGKYSQTLKIYSQLLRFGTVPVVSLATCRDKWTAASGSAAGNKILDTNICYAGNNIYSTCYGDAGGPVVATVGGVKTLIGLHSAHLNRYLDITTQVILTQICRVDVPVAGTRVGAYYASFIAPTIAG